MSTVLTVLLIAVLTVGVITGTSMLEAWIERRRVRVAADFEKKDRP